MMTMMKPSSTSLLRLSRGLANGSTRQRFTIRTNSSMTAVSKKPSPKNLLVNQRAATSLAIQQYQQRPPYESDLVVVLDMDECLLHSQFLSPQAARLAHQVADAQEWNSRTTVETFHVTLPDGDVAHVYQRPFLLPFLKEVTKRYETHIFTAAMSVYAKPVLDYLDPLDQLAGRWYRESCVFRDNAYIKDLGVLQKSSLDRVVLVDNNPLSFLANPENGILVKSFYSDASDKTLLAVLDLLQELEHEPDVKPLLEQKFGLKAALHDVNRQGQM